MHSHIPSVLMVSTGGFTQSAAIIILAALVVFYMLRGSGDPNKADESPVGVDFFAAIVVGILVSTSRFVYNLASAVPNWLTDKAAEQNIVGAGVYWFIVGALFLGASWAYLKGFGTRRRGRGSKVWLVLVLLMSVLLASSAFGKELVDGLNRLVG